MTNPVLADENFRAQILRGVRRLVPQADIATIQELGLRGLADAGVLEVAADAGRVLLTHDRDTVPPVAYRRVRDGLPMPGVVVVPWRAAIGPTAEDLAIVIGAVPPEDLAGQVIYVPLR